MFPDRVVFEHSYAKDHVVVKSRDTRRRSGNGRRPDRHRRSEKSRRSEMREYLRRLTELVPDLRGRTTNSVLQRAVRVIHSLEERERAHSAHKKRLAMQQQYLRKRLLYLSLTLC